MKNSMSQEMIKQVNEALFKSYIVIYHVEVETQICKYVCAAPYIEEITNEQRLASENFKIVAETVIDNEYRSGFLNFTDMLTLSYRMGDQEQISFLFLGVNKGWCQAKFITCERNKDGSAKTVLFLVEILNKDMSELEEKIKLEGTLVKCAQILSSSYNVEQAIQCLLEYVSAFHGADCGYIITYDKSKDEFSRLFENYKFGINDQVEHFREVGINVVKLWQEEYQFNEILRVSNVGVYDEKDTDNFAKNILLHQYDITSFIGKTFFIKENVNGYICFINPIRNFDIRLLLDSVPLFLANELEKKEYMDALYKNIELLKIAQQEAINANNAKSAFLANMSHEIRTPINAVMGMNEMILRECDDENVRQYAMNAFLASKEILSIVNGILDMSKIESGKMEIIPAEYDLSSLINDVVNIVSFRAKAKDIDFLLKVNGDIPERLYGDDLRLRQVINNLLSNAVKYTSSGSVTLEINGVVEGDNTLNMYVCVKDTGIGIKEEDLPKLFEKFRRIEESRNRNIEGTGLGMNIALQILRMMGSTLKVESVYGEGSSFYFNVKQGIRGTDPVGDIEERMKKLHLRYSHSIQYVAPDANILVVDDNAMNRVVVTKLLHELKANITEASSAKECIELTKKYRYDIILLDHMMPEMDGIEALHVMKADSGNKCLDIPVIALTANAISGAKEKYLSEGFSDYLTKPIDSARLEGMIRQYLPIEKVIPNERDEYQTKVEDNKVETLPELDGFDWEYARRYLRDNESILDMLSQFERAIPKFKETIMEHFKSIENADDLDQFRIQVHSIKSNAGTLGHLMVFQLAKQLEYAAKDKNVEKIKALTPYFFDELDSCERILNECECIHENKSESEDYNALVIQLEELEQSISNLDFIRSDEIMGQIYSLKYKPQIQALIEELFQAEQNYNDETVVKCCREIREELRNESIIC